MTVVVNLRNSKEEKVLLAFLNSLEYDYQTDSSSVALSEEQQKEVLRRENAFAEGKTAARSWKTLKTILKTYTVKLFTEAELDITDACKWYESQQKGLAKKFLAEIKHYLEQIAADPFHFPIRFSERFRFATLQKFPYLIIFTVQVESKTVFVNSVFHTSRNPVNL